jgi:hypothetical protein
MYKRMFENTRYEWKKYKCVNAMTWSHGVCERKVWATGGSQDHGHLQDDKALCLPTSALEENEYRARG